MAPFMANAISIDSFESTIENKNKQLTKLQLREYLSTIRGIKIDWSSKVENVWHNGTTYTIDFEGKTQIVSKIHFTYKILDKATALKLNKYQEYTFSGEVDNCWLWDKVECTVNITGFK